MKSKPKTTVEIQYVDAEKLEHLQKATGLSIQDVTSIGIRRLIDEFEESGMITVRTRKLSA
ncbi:hypothetical protein QEH56_21145 [Pelagicoccus enzymogenes]|uniref:hypothetical protein n=1 Tax=Pelagicoccus enzymogenes TaxID=2773457 RepID=UPI00280E3748|nr:hypothetical protein [Pelagicoccus enzymogenes]MDQ8200687.1 hypothetical protein [Pelagicoccus enzymogenes]